MVDDLGHVKLKERTLEGSTSHGWERHTLSTTVPYGDEARRRTC